MISGKTIAKGAFIVMMATLLSRFFGFIREMVVARYFGLTGMTDAYLVAYTVPSGVAMAVSAALSAGFIPVISNYIVNKDRENAIKVTNSLFNLFFIVLLFVVVIAMGLAPFLVRILAPGFQGDSVVLTTNLIRIMFPALIFVGLVGLASGYLNSYQHFLVPASGPMVTSIIIIISVMLFSSTMGIKGLALGTMIGLTGQFFIQIPVMYHNGYRYRFDISLRHPGVVRSLKLMVPVLIASLAPPLLLLVERGLASTLRTGSISALNYAFRLMQLPQGLFVMAVSVPLFPALSSLAAQKEYEKLKQIINKGIIILAAVMIPASAGLIALDQPIVRLLFERGAFEAKDTVTTAYALAFYSLALLPLALRDIFRRGFYAVQDALTPVIITVGALILNVISDFVLVKFMGVGGLALGAALSTFGEALILYLLLNKKLNGLPWKSFAIILFKLLVAAVVMGITANKLGLFIESHMDISKTLIRIVQVGISMLGGIFVYLVCLVVLKVEVVKDLFQVGQGLKHKLLRK